MIQLPQDVLSLNSFLCGQLNRETGSGVCGRCVNGTGPSVTSVGSQCAQCSPENVLYYVLLHYLPATIIFLFILIVQVDITSTPVVYYILYINAWIVYLQTPDGFSTYVAFTGDSYKYTLRAVFILHSIWSFDPLYFVSPPLCISSNLEDTNIPYFEVLKTLYPFLLLLMAYVGIELHARDFKPVVVLWKPIYQNLIRLRRSWNPHISLVQAFATIFFVSYLKLLSLVSVPFILTDFIDDHGKYVQRSKVIYIDPTVPVGHSKQVYLIAVSMAILFFIILPPILLLVAYPTRMFRKLQDHLPPRLNIALKIFVSVYQGPYKDGTNGTRDYRILSGLFLAAFLVVMTLQYGLNSMAVFSNRKPLVIWQINVISFIFFTAVFAVLRPHKSELANNMGICLGALLSIGATLHIFVATYFTVDMPVIFSAVAVLSIPHFVFSSYVVYRVGSKLGFKRAIRKFCRDVQSSELEEQAILNHA